jgi:hypothetical protein
MTEKLEWLWAFVKETVLLTRDHEYLRVGARQSSNGFSQGWLDEAVSPILVPLKL